MSLVEAIVVLVVMGVFLTFAVPSMIKAKMKARDKTAQSQLALIQDAEKMHRLEQNEYQSCNSIIACNRDLDIDLSPSGYWSYSVLQVDNEATPPTFCAQAANEEDPPRTWRIDQDDLEASLGTCGE